MNEKGRLIMWKYEYKMDAEINKDKVWALYENVENWKLWDDSVSSVDLDGVFENGTTGAVHNTDDSITPFELHDVKPGKCYTMHTRIPELGLNVNFGHLISPRDIGVYTITHTLEIEGNAAEIIGGQMGPELSKDFAKSIEAVIKNAGGKKVDF